IADLDNGLVILNIEVPANLTYVGNYKTNMSIWQNGAKDVAISGKYAYLAASETGLVVLEIPSATVKEEEEEEDESSLPSVSMIPALMSIGLIAILRRK
ncbi:MAG: hypothetical protein QF482_05790, partial [Candidatus Poseidoniia archaeon]|nr:hypothetical protein [Candidatus Poseidoniia archaeon]